MLVIKRFWTPYDRYGLSVQGPVCSRAVTLTEILIAVAILGFVTVTVAGLVIYSTGYIRSKQDTVQALRLLSSVTENIRRTLAADFDSSLDNLDYAVPGFIVGVDVKTVPVTFSFIQNGNHENYQPPGEHVKRIYVTVRNDQNEGAEKDYSVFFCVTRLAEVKSD